MVTKGWLGPRVPLQMGALVLFEAPRLIGGVAALVTGEGLGPRVPGQMGALVLFEVPRADRWGSCTGNRRRAWAARPRADGCAGAV